MIYILDHATYSMESIVCVNELRHKQNGKGISPFWFFTSAAVPGSYTVSFVPSNGETRPYIKSPTKTMHLLFFLDSKLRRGRLASRNELSLYHSSGPGSRNAFENCVGGTSWGPRWFTSFYLLCCTCFPLPRGKGNEESDCDIFQGGKSLKPEIYFFEEFFLGLFVSPDVFVVYWCILTIVFLVGGRVTVSGESLPFTRKVRLAHPSSFFLSFAGRRLWQGSPLICLITPETSAAERSREGQDKQVAWGFP